eukprot:m.129682 g.129682  ORF g.129682 m.129682 type:complete len:196 (-) comp9773_c0_seq2:2746-3333(-)
MSARLGRVALGRTVFLLCDVQEKFRLHIHQMPTVIETCRRLVEASKILDIPLLVTEQYPKALGATVSELDIEHGKTYPKTTFSMVTDDIRAELDKLPDLNSAVLFGIETQVCVQATALDLLERGLDVHVIADAVSSRSPVDRRYGIERMRQAGAFVTTTESMLFQLMKDSKHPQFKQVQKLIVNLPPDVEKLDSH